MSDDRHGDDDAVTSPVRRSDAIAETSMTGWAVPRAAYVHIPFCRHRCGYCNFSVVAGRDDLIGRTIDAIDRELASLNRPLVKTLFVGGGTPTHLPMRDLERLLERLHDRLRLEDAFEWSVEANPEDITRQKLSLLADAGVNRISLGVQSFQSAKLLTLERGHQGEHACRAIELAAKYIPNVSLDLIFATPGESAASWRSDLETALSLPIRHLSTYTLTFEKGTMFWNRRLKGQMHGVSEEDEVAMYSLARELTAKRGWEHYEVSNFASAGYRCAHNLAYWKGDGWFAAGPGAARCVNAVREVNHRSTTTYLRRSEAGASVVAESEAISPTQFARELAAFGVRLMDGFAIDVVSTRLGISIRELCARAIHRTAELGLLDDTDGRLRLTENGILFADTVASEFLSE